MDKGAVETISFLQPALGNFNGIGAVDIQTNINSNKPADTTAATDNIDNNDASVNAPAADAPPSARSSNSATKHKH
jgi:hypothetical protein